MAYATISDLTTLWRTMTTAEQTRATELLDTVSARLRVEANKVGKDLDALIEADVDLASVAKSVTCDIVARTMMTATDKEPMTQFAESAGGYSVSGTFLVPGGGLFVKKSELASLGIRRQQYGGLELYDD